MAPVISADLEALRRATTGQVVAPDDPAYDEARRVWNGAIDGRPALVVRCASAHDVGEAIRFARAHDLEIAVRGGAHSTGGKSVVDDGLMIDLSLLHDVSVDVEGRRCTVGGGATLGQRDTATQHHGLATTAGIVSHTGVGGLTLGGGMGWLTRKHGLALDNLLSVEIVTADGEVRTASATQHPDLFWAVRGGGGNFGVVTKFEFALHPVGPVVPFAMFFCPADQGADVFALVRELFDTMSTDVNIFLACNTAPPAPFVPPEIQGSPGYTLLVAGFGPEDEHVEVVERIRERLRPAAEMVGPMPYLHVQQLLDEGNAWGRHAYDKALYLQDFTDDAVAVMRDHLARRTSPLTAVVFYRLDGAYSEVAEDATAFSGGRSPRYAMFLIGMAADRDGFERERAWVRAFWDAMQPHALETRSYVNGDAETPDEWVRSSYGPTKYGRLAEIKRRWDPDNVFRRNANIPPALQPPRPREPAS